MFHTAIPQLPGGDPTVLNKPMHLCTSIDDDGSSIFNGYVANLALFSNVRSESGRIGGAMSMSIIKFGSCV